jgi:Carboxypeptidase regulatory-like domain
MKHTIRLVAMWMAVSAVACTKNTNGPSNSTTVSTTVATTSASTTTASTTSQQATFTVTGRVTSEKTGESLQFADIEIIQGVNIGRRFQGDSSGNYTMAGLQPGAFVARYWAPGYLVRDVLITITTSDQTVNVQLTPAPPPTTTATGLAAIFTWTPNPCTIDIPGVNCTVDGSGSTGDIKQYHWAYAGKDVFDQVTLGLSFNCGNLIGTGVNVTLNVRLTVVDSAGNANSLDQGVPVTKLNGVCP